MFVKSAFGKGLVRSPGRLPEVVDAANEFSRSEARIYYVFTVSNAKGAHKYTNRWLRPDGAMQLGFDFFGVSARGLYGGDPWLEIAGVDAARYPGRWQVEFQIDGARVDTKEFQLR